MNLKIISLSALLLTLSLAALAAPDATKCPADKVNFWKNYAVSADNGDVVPRFLLNNNCFRARVTTDFHSIMLKRLDNPDQDELVDQLFTQLSWTNGYDYR